MPIISAQAGNFTRVIDLHGAAWRTEPRSTGSGQPKRAAACCPDCARFDQWVGSIGGIAGKQFAALRAEALEFAGPDGYSAYLAAAQAIDEEHAAGAGGWLAREIKLANAESTRQAEQAARQAAEEAAAGALQRADEIRLAVEQLRDHPRLAADPDLGTGPDMGSAEVAHGLRVAMGLASRPSTPYEESLPPVADLGRRIGVRSRGRR